jgi:hypothetical protein
MGRLILKSDREMDALLEEYDARRQRSYATGHMVHDFVRLVRQLRGERDEANAENRLIRERHGVS